MKGNWEFYDLTSCLRETATMLNMRSTNSTMFQACNTRRWSLGFKYRYCVIGLSVLKTFFAFVRKRKSETGEMKCVEDNQTACQLPTTVKDFSNRVMSILSSMFSVHVWKLDDLVFEDQYLPLGYFRGNRYHVKTRKRRTPSLEWRRSRYKAVEINMSSMAFMFCVSFNFKSSLSLQYCVRTSGVGEAG